MRPFPGSAYVDADVFARERARIFEDAWICVGREEEVALPGQFVRAVVTGARGPEPLVVVRGADLELRAFFDVCRHRGASVVGRAEHGRLSCFTCPYHGWTYELDGRGANASLIAVRVETWSGFVFVSLGKESLRDFMGETPPWLGALGPLKLGRRSVAVANANWKLLVENFQESHHFPHIHDALEALTPMGKAETWLGSGKWLGGTMEIVNAETVSKSGRLNGRPLIGPAGLVHDAMMFPCLLTSLQPDYLLVYRLMPRAVDRTEITFDIWFHPAANTEDPAIYELWDQINSEDRAICEDQQANASSRAFVDLRYESVEEGMQAFDAMVTKALSE